MLVLKRKEFTSKRTKQLRNELLLKQAKTDGVNLERLTEGHIGSNGESYHLYGPGRGMAGALDRESAAKLNLPMGKTGELTKEELKRVNEKTVLDELKQQQRKRNKDVTDVFNNADPLQQKVLNKKNVITLENGKYAGAGRQYNNVTAADMEYYHSQDKKYGNKWETVRATDYERQESLRKMKEKKARQAKLAERKRLSEESISKHQTQANNLRSNKLYMGTRDAKKWVKKNPGKTALIAGGTAALVGGSIYAAKKIHDKKKENKD